MCIVCLNVPSSVLMCLEMNESPGAFEAVVCIFATTASDETAKTGLCLCICQFVFFLSVLCLCTVFVKHTLSCIISSRTVMKSALVSLSCGCACCMHCKGILLSLPYEKLIMYT